MKTLELFISTKLHAHYYIGPDIHFRVPYSRYPRWCLLCAERGAYTYAIEGVAGEAGPGDLILVPPGMELHRRSHTPVSAHFFTFDWYTRSGELLDPGGVRSGKTTVRDGMRLATTFGYLRSYGDLSEDEDCGDGFANHLLEDLLHLYKRELEAEVGVLPGDSEMGEAEVYLRNHAYRPLALSEIAGRYGIGQAQFTRRFRKFTGMVPTEYVSRLRLLRAQKLLAETDLTLDMIAEACGYQNGFYLSRVFSKRLGLSPSAYRRLHGAEKQFIR